jgi:hypothetical protein
MFHPSPGSGPVRGGRLLLEGGRELLEQGSELRHLAFPDHAGPFGLDLGQCAQRRSDLVPPAIRQSNQGRSPVGRVGPSLEVAASFQMIDQIAHRLIRHLGPLGQLGQARPVGLDVLEDGGVGRSDVFEACVGVTVRNTVDDSMKRDPQEDSDVQALVSRLAGENRMLGCWLGA